MIKDKNLRHTVLELKPSEIEFKNRYVPQKPDDPLDRLCYCLAQISTHNENYWLSINQQSKEPYATQNLNYELVGLDKCPYNAILHPRYQPYSLHRHLFYEFIIVLTGKCDNFVEGKWIPMKAGEICLLPPYTRHMIGVFDDDCIVLNIVFTREILQNKYLQILPSNTELSNFLQLTTTKNCKYSCFLADTHKDADLCFLTEQVLKIIFFPADSCNILLELLLAILLRTTHCIGDNFTLLEPSHNQSANATEYLRYLHTNSQNISLNKMAEHFNYTPDSMGRILKQNTGLTYKMLLHEIRISQACYYLILSNKSIDDITELVGYESVSYFEKLFKRTTNMTPLQFRKLFSVL